MKNILIIMLIIGFITTNSLNANSLVAFSLNSPSKNGNYTKDFKELCKKYIDKNQSNENNKQAEKVFIDQYIDNISCYCYSE